MVTCIGICDVRGNGVSVMVAMIDGESSQIGRVLNSAQLKLILVSEWVTGMLIQ